MTWRVAMARGSRVDVPGCVVPGVDASNVARGAVPDAAVPPMPAPPTVRSTEFMKNHMMVRTSTEGEKGILSTALLRRWHCGL